MPVPTSFAQDERVRAFITEVDDAAGAHGLGRSERRAIVARTVTWLTYMRSQEDLTVDELVARLGSPEQLVDEWMRGDEHQPEAVDQ